MNACIYTRTSRAEKGENTTSISKQIEHCVALARRHGLSVREDHIYSDEEIVGTAMPTCWATEFDDLARPALSAMIESIEAGKVSRVIVRRPEKLGTSYEVLNALDGFFKHHKIAVVLEEPDAIGLDPRGKFAMEVLKDVMQLDTEAECARKEKARAQKLAELQRLKDRVKRLEAEISEL